LASKLNEAIRNQLVASIDMLENAIKKCPQNQWNTDRRIWYNAYHCIFYIDYYLTRDPQNFNPPDLFTLSEFKRIDPPRVYNKEELLSYLKFCRAKAKSILENIDQIGLLEDWKKEKAIKNYSFLEIILYNLRHIQHHAAQINTWLRIEIDDAPDWIARGK